MTDNNRQSNQPATLNISPEALTASLVEAMKELKRPDPEIAAEAQEKKDRLLANQKASATEQQHIQDMRVAQQTNCAHMKGGQYAGQHTLTGQIHSDGKFHPVCHRCGKAFPPFSPGPQTIDSSETVGSDNCKYINPRTFEAWGKAQATA